jgi:hypothetical protein
MMDLEPPLIGPRDEAFHGENLHFVCVNEMMVETAAYVETAQLPPFAPKDQVGLGVGAGQDGVGKATGGTSRPGTPSAAKDSGAAIDARLLCGKSRAGCRTGSSSGKSLKN